MMKIDDALREGAVRLAQQAAVASWRRADRADLAFGEHPASATVTQPVHRTGDRLRELAAPVPLAFEQMKRHALSRLRTDARQATQRLDQAAQ